MIVLAVCRVLMPATIFDLDLNRAVADVEIVFQPMRHIPMNLLAVAYALIGHHDVAAARNQTRRNRPDVHVVGVVYARHIADRLLDFSQKYRGKVVCRWCRN